jgi:dTDP-4-dehydrorhamnose 3,5-epimerase
MKIIPKAIDEVLVLEPAVYGDERGYFMETFRASTFRESGREFTFVQDNQSRSKKGTLRGLHYQLQYPQGKLVRVTSGEVFDVAVDIRRSSSTFGSWVGETLSSENKKQLWVPPGFAHGFLVLSDEAELLYKCTDYYNPNDEHCLLWDDPGLNIAWPSIDVDPILSEKDQAAMILTKAMVYP